MKRQSAFILLVLLFNSLMMFGQTNVSGGIYNDVTWTLAGSPFIVTDNIVVFPGKTLTIEPGVEVRVQGNTHPLSGFYIEIRGGIVALGTPSAPITFKADGVVNDPYSWAGILVKTAQGGTASFNYINMSNAFEGFRSDNATVVPGVIAFENCNFTNNYYAVSPWFASIFRNCNFSNNYSGIQPSPNYGVTLELYNCNFDNNRFATSYVYDSITIDSCNFIDNEYPLVSVQAGTITNSLFDGNTLAFNGYGGILSNCEFVNNAVGIGNHSAGSVTNCIFRNNQLGIEMTTGAVLRNNEISNNLVGLKIFDNVVDFRDNRICGNTLYNVENGGDKNISIENNCFCESDSTVIEQLLFDGYDDISKGLFNYSIYDSTCTNIIQSVSKVTIITNTFDAAKQEMEVFPNPAKDVLHVRFPLGITEGVLRIVNLQGQEMLRTELLEENTLDVSSLARGIYLLQVNGAQQFVKKWVKE